MVKPISRLQSLSQTQIQKLGAIPSSIGAINRIRPIQKIGPTSDTKTNTLADYNNPDEINSIADVITRTKLDKSPTGALYAVGGIVDIIGDFTKATIPLTAGISIPLSVVLDVTGKTIKAGALLADKDFRKYIKDYYIDPALSGNWTAVGYNALQGFSETADLLAQPVKAFMPLAGGSAEEGFDNLMNSAAGALGIQTDYGRKNYDYNTGFWLSDMLLEVVSDPINAIDFTSGITKYGAKASEGVDTLSKHQQKRYLKNTRKVKEVSVPTTRESPLSEARFRLALNKQYRLAKKTSKPPKSSERRIKSINRNYDRLKANRKKQYVDKWIKYEKEIYTPEELAKDPELIDPTFIANQLDNTFLDSEYKQDMQAIELAREKELDALMGVSKTATDVDTNLESRARAYTELVDNHYNSSRFNKLDAAERRVDVLEQAPAAIQNTTVWKNYYQSAKAARDKARVEANLKTNRDAQVNVMSEENVETLTNLSTRPSENTELLEGVGGTAATVINTASKIQNVSNAVDRGVMHLATLNTFKTIGTAVKFAMRGTATGLRVTKAGQAFVQKISEKANEALVNIEKALKLRKTTDNATEFMFSKYTNKAGMLDLSRLNQSIPAYTEYAHRIKTLYEKATSPEGYQFYKPDHSILTEKIIQSAKYLKQTLTNASFSGAVAVREVDSILKILKEQLPNVITSEVALLTWGDKIKAIRMYIAYLQNLKKAGIKGFESVADSIINKLEKFISSVQEGLKINQYIKTIEDFENTVPFARKYDFILKGEVPKDVPIGAAQLNVFDNITGNLSGAYAAISSPDFQIKEETIPKLNDLLLKLAQVAPGVIPKDAALRKALTEDNLFQLYKYINTNNSHEALLNKANALEYYIAYVNKHVKAIKEYVENIKGNIREDLYRSGAFATTTTMDSTGKIVSEYDFNKIIPEKDELQLVLDTAKLICTEEEYQDVCRWISFAYTSTLAQDFIDTTTVLINKVKDPGVIVNTQLENTLQNIGESYSELLDMLEEFVKIPTLRHEVTKGAGPLLELIRVVKDAKKNLNEFKGYYAPEGVLVDSATSLNNVRLTNPKLRNGDPSGYIVPTYKDPYLIPTVNELSNAGIERSGLLQNVDESLSTFHESLKNFKNQIVEPLWDTVVHVEKARNSLQAAATAYDSARVKKYKNAIDSLQKAQAVSADYRDRLKQYISEVDANKEVTLKRVLKDADGSSQIVEETITINDLFTDTARSPLLRPLYTYKGVDEALFKKFTESAENVRKGLEILFNRPETQDYYALEYHFGMLIANSPKKGVVESTPAESAIPFKQIEKQLYDKYLKVDSFEKNSFTKSKVLQIIFQSYAKDYKEVYKNLIKAGVEPKHVFDKVISETIESVRSDTRKAVIRDIIDDGFTKFFIDMAARKAIPTQDISRFGELFRQVYNFYTSFKSLHQLSDKSISTMTALLQFRENLAEFAELLPDTSNMLVFKKMVENFLSVENPIEYTRNFNLDPNKKAYQVFLSTTNAFIDFNTDEQVSKIFYSVLHPIKNSDNALEQLSYYFSKAKDQTNGAWLANTPFGAIFEPQAYDNVNDALNALRLAAVEHDNQIRFMDNVFLNPAFALDTFEETDGRRDALRIAILDSLTNYSTVSGEMFKDNFDYHFQQYLNRLYSNERCHLSSESYSLENLHKYRLKGDLKKQADALPHHDASADVQITELVIKQMAEDGKPILSIEPNFNYIIVDSEFSVNTDLSKGTYTPLQVAYKTYNQDDVVNLKMRADADSYIDSRTLDFFKKTKGVESYTLDDFKKDWCSEELPTRNQAFIDFFTDLFTREKQQGKPIKLVAHNGAAADMLLLEHEFKLIKPYLYSFNNPKHIFYNAKEADDWFAQLKLNSEDTLVNLRKADGVAALSTIQIEELRRIVSAYIQDNIDTKSTHLMRSISDNFFDGMNVLSSGMVHARELSKYLTPEETISALDTSERNALWNKFINDIINTKDVIRSKLRQHKLPEGDYYYFYLDDLVAADIKLDGKSLVNTTAFNNAAGAITYFGFRRISTPELANFFDESAIENAINFKTISSYIRSAEEMYASIDKIRYPQVLKKYEPELRRTLEILHQTIVDMPVNAPGVNTRVTLAHHTTPSELPALFILTRRLYNYYKNYLKDLYETHKYPAFEKLVSTDDTRLIMPELPASIVALFENENPELYTNHFDAEGFTMISENMRNLIRQSDTELDAFRKRAEQCCNNEVERLEQVSEYLENLNKLGYNKYTKTKTNLITNRIIPIVKKFDEQPIEYTSNAKKLFANIPQNQLDNRFKDFNSEKGVLLYNDLLYNPLHTIIAHKDNLASYGNLKKALSKYAPEIKYKELDDIVYIYLNSTTLNKYTFDKGLPYLSNVLVPKSAYKASINTDISEVQELQNAVVELLDLPSDYFSDSCGRSFSQEHLMEIYKRIPDEVTSELPFINEVTLADVYKGGPVLNNILLGDWHMQSMFLANKVQDPFVSYVIAAQQLVSDMHLRTQWLHYFFDTSDGLSLILDESGSLLDNTLLSEFNSTSVAELCAALEVNKTYTLVACITDSDKPRILELSSKYPTVIERILQERKYPIKLMSKAEALTVKNIVERPTASYLQRFWNAGIRVFKNAVLFSLGNLIRNTVDTFLKTTIELGAVDTINYTYEAMRLRREYNKVMELATSTNFILEDAPSAGLFNNKVLDYLFSPKHQALLQSKGITIDREMFDFIQAFKESDAASAMHKLQENQKRYRYAFLNSEDHLKNPELLFEDWLKQQNTLKGALKKGVGFKNMLKGVGKSTEGLYNRVLAAFITPSSYIEDINRLAMYLKYSDDGLLTKTSIFQKIKDTHFNFNYKTDITTKIEQFIPFYNFTKENAVYWLNLLEDRPELIKIITDVMTPLLDLDSYNVEELERNRSLINTITNGYIKLSKDSEVRLKLNPSFMDAFTIFTNPVSAFQQGFIIDTPQSREELMQWEGGWKDALKNTADTLVAAWPTTIAQRVEAIMRNQKRLSESYKTTQTPLIRQGLQRAMATVSSTFTVPNRYRNAKYTSGQYYRRWRNYRSPVRSIYIKTGISKLQILMEPVSPDNIKYKLGVMQSFVNRQ